MSSEEVTSPNSGLRAGNSHRFRVGRPEGTREKNRLRVCTKVIVMPAEVGVIRGKRVGGPVRFPLLWSCENDSERESAGVGGVARSLAVETLRSGQNQCDYVEGAVFYIKLTNKMVYNILN
ncbi:hypothetical protein CDAR_25381 [Caerostris darwini]|uniref:Uncharacterized protein n=1 Tax=Caerostris darwini TaxID=1538125 RepID=A0AAV4RUP1_9ARAC|nr:hypothetical protein CDAR_25381 [Caerostris darwini]